jgi:hypothetical protein
LQFDAVADVALDVRAGEPHEQANSLFISDGDGGMNNRVIKLNAKTLQVHTWTAAVFISRLSLHTS